MFLYKIFIILFLQYYFKIHKIKNFVKTILNIINLFLKNLYFDNSNQAQYFKVSFEYTKSLNHK